MMILQSCLRRLATDISRKIMFPPADRNKSFILEVLKKHFNSEKPGTVLEVASGTGQHVSYFAENFPNLTFQPSEFDHSLFDSIREFAKDTWTKNVKEPISIDTSMPPESWGLNGKEYDYMISINLIHVSPFKCTIGLFKGANVFLKVGGILVTYGAYAHNGLITPQSNVDFDKHIRTQNPEWGLRDIVDVEKIARENDIKLLHIYDLPANNKCLVWQNTEKKKVINSKQINKKS